MTATTLTSASATFSGDVGVVGFLKVGNASTPGRLKFASSSTDFTLLGTQSLDDTTNTRIILCASANASFPGTIQYISIGSGSNHDFYGNGTSIATGKIRTGFLTLSGTGTALSVTNNATIGGNLTVTGTLGSGAVSPSSIAVTGNATVGGTLGVTGNTTLTGTLTINGAATALTITNNVSIGGGKKKAHFRHFFLRSTYCYNIDCNCCRHSSQCEQQCYDWRNIGYRSYYRHFCNL